jgi:hypothetical protein
MACDLCDAAVVSKRYFENELCWIADCTICVVPMVVWREHDHQPSDEVKKQLHEFLGQVADAEFNGEEWYIDDNMRNIPDHYHAHARPPGFWRRVIT